MTERPPLPPGQPDELSPLDYLLHRGEAYPATRSAFLNLEILDRPARLAGCARRWTGPAGWWSDRQGVVIPPVPTTPPRWVVDPDFDLDCHLRRVRCPLRARCASSSTWPRSRCSRRLTPRAPCGHVRRGPRRRPTAAMMIKLSHAITDGLAGSPCSSRSTTPSGRLTAADAAVPVPRDLTGDDCCATTSAVAGHDACPPARVARPRGGCVGGLVMRPGATVTEAVRFADSARRMLGPPPADGRRPAAPEPASPGPSCSNCRSPTCVPRPSGAETSVNDAYLTALCGGLGRSTRCSACRSTPPAGPAGQPASATARPRATGPRRHHRRAGRRSRYRGPDEADTPAAITRGQAGH